MNWKRSLIFIVSLVLLLPFEQWVHACGGDINPYDEYPSFFMPNKAGRPVYTPFYFTDYFAFYDEGWGYDEWIKYGPVDQNIREWQAYTTKDIKEADIDSFVYAYPPEALSGLYYHIEKGKPLQVSKTVEQNSFSKWFIEHKDLEALGYLMFAKKCEPHAQAESGYYKKDTYEWVTEPRDTARMRKLIKDGKQLHAAAKNESIKMRYAYQVMRMSFYSYQYKQTTDLFDELVGGKEINSAIYNRCLSLKAGAMYKLGDKLQAAYLYSRAFDKTDDRKADNYLSYKWCDVPAKDLVKLCKDDHERAVVYLMEGLYEREEQEKEGLALMEEAYRLDNTIDGLEVIMGRELNKAEKRLMAPQYYRESVKENYMWTWSEAEDKEKDKNYRAYLGKLDGFARKIVQENKRSDKALWLLSSSYIQYMLGDYRESKKQMDAAAATAMSNEEKALQEVLKMLYIVKGKGSLDKAAEEEVLPSLQKLEALAKNSAQQGKIFRDMMIYVFTNTYMKQADSVKAVFAYAKTMQEGSGWSYSYDAGVSGTLLDEMSIEKIEEVQAFYLGKKKSAFDQWLTGNSMYDMNKLREMKGTKYIRLYRFEEAVGVLGKVSPEVINNSRVPDVFAFHTDDAYDIYPEDTMMVYNKLSFARAMAELQRKLNKNPKDAVAAFNYATGLYGMSYYGKGAELFTYYRSSTDDDAYYQTEARQKMPAHKQDFYGVQTAEKYYMQAFSNTGDNELKAKCLFMAAKCWQKRCPMPPKDENGYFWGSGNDAYFVNGLKNPYFMQLSEQYKETKYYDEAYNTCAYLRAYITRR
jgi:hypothetical protein